MKLFSKDGLEMMDVKSIAQEGDRIVLKGKMMGTMNTVIYVSPKDMWSAFRLFPLPLILRMPLLLFKGWQQSKQDAAPKIAQPK